MNRKRRSTRTFPIVVFIALVIVIGLGLAATGHLSNPFGFLMQGRGPQMGAEGAPAGNRSRPSAPAGGSFQPRERGGTEGGGSTDAITINWSQAGDVAFNLWFLAATTAVIIVVSKFSGFLIRQVRQRRQPVAA